ncbi:MAG: bifunctional diaminohydroxyphosphoribosylaminopyrimidine deaminase/5-amino-6-(5-phosphoribosylamino)uracil reductase RibD [Oscillibacter sp.]|nr:bifunctional diaminohydroxyphosphoribosylaminopyrimidine deaminase/5-amino-6-(5-phosphoribosylamino)uracil reductase RibD [Oscillibacter sp.]
MNDGNFMRMAIDLARQGRPSPNPYVGAVIVRENRVIGRGWHTRCGELHAERHALANCTESPAGATLYVTLEPCCHQGRQPPCTSAILEAGIKRVVIGSPDPNPLVAGKGIGILRENGVEVTENVLRSECDALNQVFFHYIRTKRPYVVMKYAMTLDGKIAAYTGASQWITGEAARRRVHEDRDRYTAILAGVGTVLADDPLLTCRIEGGHNPIRIICDSHLRTPLDSQIIRTAREVPTILAVCEAAKEKVSAYEAAGCQVWTLPSKEGQVDLAALMDRLGTAEIDSILLEGGGTLNWSMLEAGLIRRVQAYISPKIFGGNAKTPVQGQGVALPAEAFRLTGINLTQIGEDILLEGEVDANVYGNR